MKIATTFLVSLVLVVLTCSTAVAQVQKTSPANQLLEQQYGPNYEEILAKYGHDPVKLQEAVDAHWAALYAKRFYYGLNQNSHYVVRPEAEPNDFFGTADDINDVLAAPGWRGDGEFTGGLISAAFTEGDFDVYSFTVDTTKMYYFGGSHSFPDIVNFDDDGLGVSMRLFHESDTDTTFVTDFNGRADNNQILGDILGSTTDHRSNSGDFRLTGWVSPIDPATGAQLTGTFYLFIYNGEGGGSPKSIISLGGTGTYHFSAYAIDMEPWVSKAEPNQTFQDVLLNADSALPPDGVVRTFMAFNPDTVKVVKPNDARSDIDPTQGNSVFPQLLAQGDEDVDHYRIEGLKADHVLVIETLPYFGWYRDPDGSMGPGDTRWTDSRCLLFNADYTDLRIDNDDGAREVQSTTGSPNNIHCRIEYDVREEDVGAPMWLWVSAWASATRDPDQGVDNRDPGRFMYDIYVHQYSKDPVEVEPNNTVAEATSIAARSNTAVTGSFSDGADEDYYRVFMHQQRMYSLLSLNSTVTSPIGVELYLETEDENGVKSLSGDLLAGNNVVGALGNDFRLSGFVPMESGAYLIKLSAVEAGDYQLAVFEAEIFPRLVANEPDDTSGDALANDRIDVGVGSPRLNGMIFPAGDVDHYVFSGVASQQVSLKLQSAAFEVTNNDFVGEINLLDDALNVLATGTPASDAISQITFTLPSDGTYIIQIKAQDGTSDDYGNNNVGLYSLNVGEPIREIEPNDTPASATVLLSGFIAGTMTAGDIDYYRVPTQAGRIYHIRLANNDLGGAMGVDLFLASDPNTSIWDGSDWAGRYSDNNFKIQLLPTEDTEYLVQLTEPASLGGGNYEIHIKSNDITELTGAFEPNDDFSQADAIGNIPLDGVVRQAMLYNANNAGEEFAFDSDYYRVEITEPGKTLTCETIPFDGEFWSRDSDMYMQIYDAGGNQIASNDDGGFDWHSKISVEITEAGVYYCRIASQDFIDTDPPNDSDRDPTTGEYMFQITYANEEAEPNDDFNTATLITAQGATNATFAEAGEVDIFQLDLQAGNIYHIRTFRADGMDSFGNTANLFRDPDTTNGITDSETSGWRTRNNGSNVKLNIIPDEDATYYLRIEAPAELGDGTYQVILKANPLDPIRTAGEPNNTFDEADAQPEHPADGELYEFMLYDETVVGASPAESFHDDLDYYRVTANPGDIITGETHPFDGEIWPRDFDGYMYLYGPDRQIIDNDDDGGFDWHSKIEHTVQVAGTYYFLVIGQDAAVEPRNQTESRWRDPARGEYKFSLTQLIGVGIEEDGLPKTYALESNYPNPFNPRTTITYQLPELANVTLDVFNILGQRVAQLVDQHQAPGSYTVQFDAANLASGIYLYRLKTSNFIQTKTMLLMK